MRHHFLASTVAGALLLSAGAAEANKRYVVIDLGSGSTPRAINATGQVAGHGPVRDLWITGPNGQNKRSLPLPTGTYSTQALGITDTGRMLSMVVIGSGNSGRAQYLITEPNGGAWTDLRQLYGSGVVPNGVTSDGRIFGYLPARNNAAFVTQPNAGTFVTDIGVPSGYGFIYAYGANASGQVTGYASSEGRDRYFITGANAANPQLLKDGRGFGINATGQIVGETVNSRAFVTGSSGEGEVDLKVCLSSDGPNPIKFIRSEAKAINASGVVVGNCNTGGEHTRGAVTGDEGFMELTDLLDTEGWVITHAFDINDMGQIVGVGVFNGQVHGVMLQPQ